ncbi:HPr kinase/phosphorylase [Acholeplasma oculi]|uniref:HPr kinase/phosphorylase n=1 Tax=Acholeplasma oculi TaxID=35623 RepID=A0A061AGN5_9MOLU|nr:HPr(Ser) kinase/phosphatase [Acholeplasma oculi]CDR30122.1 HPr(Ser) kinase/phosphorylase [Acholeplasma oculi]SKC44666.1 Hpr(Ser) kinase/phosphatase [Acholeplasma oculi]SUT88422.1 HPr kinase/phosphorylase [Acholeplasma oculi]
MAYTRTISVKKIAKDMELNLIAGGKGEDRRVSVEMLARPGVEFAGFLDFYDPERILLIGSKEAHFLMLLDEDTQIKRVDAVLKLLPPAVIFSVNVEIPEYFKTLSNKYDVPIYHSNERTTPINSKLYAYLRSALAPRETIHGTLLDIYGLGTLIIGKSGVGKSETALELIKRNHILVADDRVDVYETAPGILIGQAPKIIERYLEIRGIGIVDVVQMLGAGAFRENKKIRLVIELEHWDQSKNYDRLGLETETYAIFGSKIPKMTIPVLPGRNNATLVESAAMNQKLKYLGYNAAEELIKNVATKAASKGDDDDENF